MDTLSLFGLSAVTAMLICYALEDRSRTFILAFAASFVSVPPTGSCKERGRSDCLRQFGRWSPYGDGLGDVRHLSNLSQQVGVDTTFLFGEIRA